MTPADAKTRWCPFAVTMIPERINPAAHNRTTDGFPDPACLCIADQCMAWRNRILGQDGYCGLAGTDLVS